MIIVERSYRFTGDDRRNLAGDLMAAMQLGLTVTVDTIPAVETPDAGERRYRHVRLIITPPGAAS